MALGFNQAGLLFATSRKSTVERKAMGIANDKICMARESQALSEDYSRQQNLRKLVWEDSNGVQEDLRFNTITAPFATGNTNYIMTNVGGKMIVDSAMMKRFGLTGDTGKLTIGRNEFLKQFDDPFAEIKGTKIDPTQFTPGPGIIQNDEEIRTRRKQTSFSEMDVTNLQSYWQEFNSLLSKDGNVVKEYSAETKNDLLRLAEDNITFLNELIANVNKNMGTLPQEAKKPTSPYYGQYTHYLDEKKPLDLMKKQYELIKVCLNENTKVGAGLLSLILSDKAISVGDVIPYDDGKGEQPRKDLLNAIGKIWEVKVDNNNGSIASSINVTTGEHFFGANKKYIGVFSNFHTQINVNGETSKIKDWVTQLDGLRGNGGTTNSLTTQDYVDYYDSIWKHLTYKGWIKEDRVSDPKFLENSLRSGGIYIEKQAPGYSFSRIAWQSDASCAIRDVRDKTGVNLAQIEYERKKAQLDQKEGTMDVAMRNLDMERASLEAQIDTIKAVITKNVERSFKMFQA